MRTPRQARQTALDHGGRLKRRNSVRHVLRRSGSCPSAPPVSRRARLHVLVRAAWSPWGVQASACSGSCLHRRARRGGHDRDGVDAGVCAGGHLDDRLGSHPQRVRHHARDVVVGVLSVGVDVHRGRVISRRERPSIGRAGRGLGRDELVASEHAKGVRCRADRHLLSLGLDVHGSRVELVVDAARGTLERHCLAGVGASPLRAVARTASHDIRPPRVRRRGRCRTTPGCAEAARRARQGSRR